MGKEILSKAAKTFLQAANKESLLQTRALSKTAKTKELGWIRPDSVISFADEGTAYKYAKNSIVKELNVESPREVSIVWKDNLIKYKSIGDADQCTVQANHEGVWLHGHPDKYKGGTVPFSATDYKTFMESDNFTKAVVFNKSGETCEMTKLPIKQGLLYKLIKKIANPVIAESTVKGEKIDYADSGFSKIVYSYSKPLIKYKILQKQIACFFSLMLNKPEKAEKYLNETNCLIKEVCNNAGSNKCAREINDFWIKFQSKLSIKYKTDFSELK